MRLFAGSVLLLWVFGCVIPNEEGPSEMMEAGPMTAPQCFELYRDRLPLELPLDDTNQADIAPECLDYLDRLSSGECQGLMTRVCGQYDQCGESGACIAALLRAEISQEECAIALDDNLHYPECDQRSYCEALVELVCGAPREQHQPCGSKPGCWQVRLYEEESTCREALQEPSLYPHCQL